MTTNKLIAECCDRVGEVYAVPAEPVAAKLTNEQAANVIANMHVQIALCGDEATALRMAEAALRAQGWQPIETAPKDSSHFIICSGGMVGEAYYEEDRGFYWSGSHWTDAHDGCIHSADAWMQLPNPHPQGEEHGG
jgi:hypothetical protein